MIEVQVEGQMDVFEVLEDVKRNGLVPGECSYCHHADGIHRSLATWCNCHCHEMHERRWGSGPRPLWNRPSSPGTDLPIPPVHSRTYTGGHRANHDDDHGDGGAAGGSSNR